MIQFNLLPDVKIAYIKAQRNKRFVMLVSISAIIVSLIVVLLLFVLVNVAQKKHLDDLGKDVVKYNNTLKNTTDISKVLTIQNQLSKLPDLHDKKPVVSRLSGYITQITPAQVKIASFNADFDAYTISVSGSADNLGTINRFVDTLKFTTYSIKDNVDKKPAFSGVVLSSFARNDKDASYSITANFDPVIFEGSKEVALTVPKIITTRSETEKPDVLFEEKKANQ